MFIPKPKVALQSILRSATEKKDSKPLPTNLAIIRDDASGPLITDPEEVIAQVQKHETQALSPDHTLSQEAPFPWLCHVTPNQQHNIPMIFGCISPSIMHEVFRHTPSHTAAGPDGIPGLILMHMPPPFHDALQLIF
jgi:hypothetical protein